MTKDEALDLALEALEGMAADLGKSESDVPAITAIKQARALDKKAENARELGLDYEPADGTQVSKVWWDGEKLMAKPIPFVEFYKPVQDSTCNETLRAQGKAYPRTCRKCGLGPCIGAPKQPPAAQRQWVGLTDEEIEKACVPLGAAMLSFTEVARAIESKLRSKNHGN